MLSFIRKVARRYLQGRIIEHKEWHTKLLNICMRWIIKTPVLPATDAHIKFIDIICKKHQRESIQVWQEAGLYLGLLDYYNRTQSKKTLQVMQLYLNKSSCNKVVDAADYGLLAFAMLKQEKSDTIVLDFLKYVKSNMGLNNIILYKPQVRNVAFVDTLGFVCPFLVQYGLMTQQFKYVELAKEQLQNYIEYGVEKNSSLPFHAYMITEKIPLGICDWARGLAWLLIGLMDSYICILEKNKNDVFFCETIKKYADILVKLQRETGAYSWKLFSQNCDSDSSATAVFGWYLANCAEIFNKKKYLESAIRCRKFLMEVTYNNGMIDYCQGDTIGVGIYSRNFDIMPFAQGFALRLEEKLNEKK